MNISSNLSSITAHQNMLDTTANNIANVNTDGFVPNEAVITNSGANIETNITATDNSGSEKSQTNLSKEIPDLMIAQAGTSVNVTAIKTQDEMLGTLLDIKS